MTASKDPEKYRLWRERLDDSTKHPMYGRRPWNKDTRGVMKKNKTSFKKGQIPWNVGKHPKPESIEKMRLAKLGKHPNQKTRDKMSRSQKKRMKIKENNPMYGRRGKDSPQWGLKRTEETKAKMRKAKLGKFLPKRHRENISKALEGNQNAKGNRFSLTKEQIKNHLRRRIPSSLEERFLSIIKKHNLPYKYTGNGSFIINNCNPDFINTNSEKIAIEVYSRYFKEKDGRNILRWKHIRRQEFLRFGWKVIFFDEVQLEEKNVLAALEGESKALAKGDTK